MTRYPGGIDDDATLIRIDDSITEIGGQAINQLRSAVFAIETTLGTNPQASAASVAARLNKSLNSDGTIRASALATAGLASLPIDNAQVGVNAGIEESKLDLNYPTADLYALVLANIASIGQVSSLSETNRCNLLLHIRGAVHLLDGITLARHVASQIDLNAVPFDSRDPGFIWPGLKDKDGNLRPATQVASALLEINDDLVDHLNAVFNAHPATAISVDTSNFEEIPKTADNVQLALDALDDADRLAMGAHRANMHVNGIPRWGRTSILTLDGSAPFPLAAYDGYNQIIVPPTPIKAFLVDSGSSPVDNNTTGDDVIEFVPDNTGFAFDALFSKVQSGDIIRINYGNGIEAAFLVDSFRFVPGAQWFVRLNENNLLDTDEAVALIQRPLFDRNTYGVVACAAANNDVDDSVPGSIIVGSPKGATAMGFGFDPDQLDSQHYKLYLQVYPTGDPRDKIINLPAIDVTGNAGQTPGKYTLRGFGQNPRGTLVEDSPIGVIEATNDAFRKSGFNYRFIAFEKDGNFGIMMADAILGASFSIVNGTISGTSLVEGSFTENVIGDQERGSTPPDGYDALGFGFSKASLASPPFQTSYSSALEAASFPTNVILPYRRRNYNVNGVKRDSLATAWLSTKDELGDGYWDGYISDYNAITGEVTYHIDLDLRAARLKPGKTIVVQPELGWKNESIANDSDYGRFILKSIVFTETCPPGDFFTELTVVNGNYAGGISSGPPLPVRIYFSEDSVGIDATNMVNASASLQFKRFFHTYVNDKGETFAHERARMLIQAETTTLLGTDVGWKILDVSAKFNGFVDESSPQPRFYTRFMLLRYNNTSGEFDGYLGRPGPGGTITDFGEVTRGRLNEPTRFYHHTNSDFIELQFDDFGGGTPPICPPLPDPNIDDPHYVDIEIFDSLERDQEVFLLAGFQQVANTGVVEITKEERQFGTVSEENFTNSAIGFVEAGDRLLHGNGVIRGLDFVGEDEIFDNVLRFAGGVGMVDGHVTVANPSEVVIPQIIEDPPGIVPQNLNWIICINKSGNFELLIDLPDKKIFLAKEPGGSVTYQVPALTFTQIIDDRPDLLPLYSVAVTVSSLSINKVTDVRRYSLRESFEIPFTLTADKTAASFETWEQMSSWVKSYKANHRKITIRGHHKITDPAQTNWADIDPIELEGIGRAVPVAGQIGFFEEGDGYTLLEFGESPGDDSFWLLQFTQIKMSNLDVILNDELLLTLDNEDPGVIETNPANKKTAFFDNVGFTIFGNTGIRPRSNTTFTDCDFYYGPTFTGEAGDLLHANSGAAIYRSFVDIVSGIFYGISFLTIEGCRFYSNVDKRPPFIGLMTKSANILFNINIKNNNFEDGGTTLTQAGVAIVQESSDDIIPPSLTNVSINDNTTSSSGGALSSIYITGHNETFNLYPLPTNVEIKNNFVHGIGINMQSFLLSVTPSFGSPLPNSFRIEDNVCVYIINASYRGQWFVKNSPKWAKAPYQISNNQTGWIQVDRHPYDDVIISQNKLFGASLAILTAIKDPDSDSSPSNTAILDFPTVVAANIEDRRGIISDNAIKNGVSFFTIGILSQAARLVKGNEIYGVGDLGGTVPAGISVSSFCEVEGNSVDLGLNAQSSANSVAIFYAGEGGVITNNTLFRRSNTIKTFVQSTGTAQRPLIKNNYFDSSENGAGGPPVIALSVTSTPNSFYSNINQEVTKIVSASEGILGITDGFFNPSNPLQARPVIGGVFPSGVTISGENALLSWRATYDGSNVERAIVWNVPLGSVLPIGARVTELTVSLGREGGGVIAGTADAQLFIRNEANTDTESTAVEDLTDGAIHGLTLTPLLGYDIAISSSATSAVLSVKIESNTTFTLICTTLGITYRW